MAGVEQGQSQYYIIDDADIGGGKLQRRGAWSALSRDGGSSGIPASTQKDRLDPILGQLRNRTVSWTTAAGSSLSLSFTGSAVFAYGVAGPDSGSFSVSLDGLEMGSFSAKSDGAIDVHRLLFAAQKLPEGNHTVILMNREEGSVLSFDYANVTGSRIDGTPRPTASQTTLVPSSSPGPSAATTGNTTSPSIPSTSIGSGLMGGAASAARQPYVFEWNGPARFVVALSCILGVAILGLIYYYFIRKHLGPSARGKLWAARSDPEAGAFGRDERFSSRPRARPTSKILAALKERKIGHPIPSDDGGSERSKRDSEPLDSPPALANYQQPGQMF